MHEQENRLRAIFVEALELTDARRRSAYLTEVCGQDTMLRHQIEELLHADARAGSFLPQDSTRPGAEGGEVDIPNAQGLRGGINRDFLELMPGQRIGSYRILKTLGEGGCGIVYMAQQERPVRRRVALKIIKLGMDTKSVVARFDAERQALALMEHPNIAKVLDAGATGSGRPYFVMELVCGVKVTVYCDRHELPIKHRLELFIKVCGAIQHAHQKGIIHRDIKPSNILVTLDDGMAVPKVIDFGIAKATQGRLTDMTLFTGFEQFLGTPAYMSPEQAELSAEDIDTRSDIYSLGVLLYELLTGKTPFDTQALRGANLDVLRRTIREQEPQRPSIKLSTMMERELTNTARRLGTEPQKLLSAVRGDLDWIVMKCLDKDRSRRYETANSLANDVSRHLNNEVVLARPPTTPYRFKKFVNRNKTSFSAACAVGLALILGLVVSLRLYLIERTARYSEVIAEKVARDKTAQAEAAVAKTRVTLAASEFSQAVQSAEEGNSIDAIAYLARSLTLNPNNDAAITRLATLLAYRAWMPPRLVVSQPGIMWTAQFSPDNRRMVTASDDGTARIWDAESGKLLVEPMRHKGPVWWVQFSPDGTRVVTASVDCTARVWDAQTGQPVTGPLQHALEVEYAQFSPDGKRVVTASRDGTAEIWDVASGRAITKKPLEHGHWVRTAQFSPDGRRVVTASDNGTALIWDAESGARLEGPLTHSSELFFAQFSPDGKWVVTTAEDGARVWDSGNGRPLTALLKHSGWVRSAEFSPDSKRLVTGSSDGTAMVWSVETGQALLAQPLKHLGSVRSVHFSPDGQRVLSASFDNKARVWDSWTGELVTQPLEHNSWVRSALFSPDGTRVVSVSDDGSAQIWGPETRVPFPGRFRHSGAISRVQFNSAGTRIVTASEDGTARVWDAHTHQPVTRPLQHRGPVYSAQFSPDGKRVITASSDGTARIWDAETSQPLIGSLPHPREVIWAQFSPDGKRVVTVCHDHLARVWDASGGGSPLLELQHEGQVFWAQFSLDSTRLVTACEDSSAYLWNAISGQKIVKLTHRSWVLSAQFSLDGARIVTASDDGTARVWDAITGKPMSEPLRHGSWVRYAQFSPDGSRVVTASDDGTARVWNVRDGQAQTQPLRHNGPVWSAEFSSDGKRIVTASRDGSARVWDPGTGQPITDPLRQTQPLRYAQFSPDGKQVVTASDDGSALVWDIGPSGTEVPSWLLKLAETISGRAVNPDGVLERSKLDRVQTLQQLRQELSHAPAQNQWAIWGRWFLSDASSRTISPYSTVSISEYMTNQLEVSTKNR